jgi:hypothetical protein
MKSTFLSNLNILNLYRNEYLTYIPREIGVLHTIRSIYYFRQSKLAFLPAEIGKTNQS